MCTARRPTRSLRAVGSPTGPLVQLIGPVVDNRVLTLNLRLNVEIETFYDSLYPLPAEPCPLPTI